MFALGLKLLLAWAEVHSFAVAVMIALRLMSPTHFSYDSHCTEIDLS